MDPKMTLIEAAEFMNFSVPGALKKLRKNDLSFSKSSNKVHWGHETSKKMFEINFKHKTIAVQIVKGGTGKTTLTYSLAIRANLYGAKVLCIDLDQQANLTKAFNVDASANPVMIDVLNGKARFIDGIMPIISGLHLFPSRIENAVLDSWLMLNNEPTDKVYKKLIEPLKKKYDLILIDCPPALGHSVSAASLVSDYVLAPVISDDFSIGGLDISINDFKILEEKYQTKIKIKILQNKFDNRTSMSHEVYKFLCADPKYKDLMVGAYVRQCQEFPKAFANKISIYDSLRPSTAKEDIDILIKNLLDIKPNISKRSLIQRR